MDTNPKINGPPLESPHQSLVVIGKCGVGKSNLVNRLANLNWPTDPVVPCTRQPALKIMTKDEFPRLAVPTAWLVDLPGFGEGRIDDLYRGFYRTWLPSASHLLWVAQADSRAYKRDELFIGELLPLLRPRTQFHVALTRIDCFALEPETPHAGRPTPQQLKYLDEKIEDVFSLFAAVIADRVPFTRASILPCSSKTGWGFDQLERLLFNEKE